MHSARNTSFFIYQPRKMRHSKHYSRILLTRARALGGYLKIIRHYKRSAAANAAARPMYRWPCSCDDEIHFSN